MLRGRLAVLVFTGWTAAVWSGRVRNVVGDHELTTSARTVALLLAASFLVPAASLLVLSVANRNRAWSRPGLGVIAALAGWTVGVWLIRAVEIAFDDHEAAFVVVHVVLALISISLAVWAVLTARLGEAELRQRGLVG